MAFAVQHAHVVFEESALSASILGKNVQSFAQAKQGWEFVLLDSKLHNLFYFKQAFS
jgi:hypothetical protein